MLGTTWKGGDLFQRSPPKNRATAALQRVPLRCTSRRSMWTSSRLRSLHLGVEIPLIQVAAASSDRLHVSARWAPYSQRISSTLSRDCSVSRRVTCLRVRLFRRTSPYTFSLRAVRRRVGFRGGELAVEADIPECTRRRVQRCRHHPERRSFCQRCHR